MQRAKDLTKFDELMTEMPLARISQEEIHLKCDLPPTENRLVHAAMRGEADALEALWRANQPWVAAVLLAHKPATEDLDDLLQETAMTMVSQISELRKPADYRGWLRTVAINIARQRGRSMQLHQPVTLNGTLSTATNETSDSLVMREQSQQILARISTLPEHYREPLLLKAVRGMTYRQIGQMLELPETTIETRIARARKMLREQKSAGEHRKARCGRQSKEKRHV